MLAAHGVLCSSHQLFGVSGGVVTFLSQYIGYDCHQVIFLPSSE